MLSKPASSRRKTEQVIPINPPSHVSAACRPDSLDQLLQRQVAALGSDRSITGRGVLGFRMENWRLTTTRTKLNQAVGLSDDMGPPQTVGWNWDVKHGIRSEA